MTHDRSSADGGDAGSAAADADALLATLYDELRGLARARLRQEPAGLTLEPTALVHEAWLRVRDGTSWNGRGHFFGAAARAMRHILVDRARRAGSAKHGGGWDRVDLSHAEPAWHDVGPATLIEIGELLERLGTADPHKADVVTLRVFGGLTNEQIADVLGVGITSIKRDWRFARAWLMAAMEAT